MLALKAENISKQYRLGEVGSKTLAHDFNKFWAKIRGKEDPYLKIGDVNDRTSKGFSEYVWSLRDINFDINQGDAVGIIGRNGAGKSTLLKLLSKVTKPTTGKIYTNGRIASLLEVGTGFHPEMTGRENIYLNGAILGMTRKEITRKFDEIVDFAGVERYIDTPVKRYSSGMYVRLAFAVAAHLESEILIVDEVLAVGDAEFQSKCLGKMGDVSKGEGRTVLFVSHNMGAIKQLCNNGIVLRNGTLDFMGSANEAIEHYNILNLQSSSSFLSKDTGIIRQLSIKQIDDKIEIFCEYKSPQEYRIPCLGFVISDLENNKIFGTNPVYSPPPQKIIPSKTGEIYCIINTPKLLNGIYTLTASIGDGTKDYETLKDVLQFEVINMVTLNKENRNSGPVFCGAEWKFINK